MPVGAVEGVALVGEKTRPGYAHQGDDVIRQRAGGGHVAGRKFHLDIMRAGGSFHSESTGGYLGGEIDPLIFIAGQRLGSQVDVDALFPGGYIRREG